MKKLLLFVFASLLVSCTMCKIAKTTSITEIRFGSGGGFTGVVTTYKLKSDGMLYNGDKQIKKLSCDSLSAIYEKAENISMPDYIHPDNMYNFVRIISTQGTQYHTWSFGNQPDKQIIDLYFQLNRQL